MQTLSFFICTVILRDNCDYPYFADKETDLGTKWFAQGYLALRADVTLRTGHFGFEAGGPFPTIYNTGEPGMLRESSRSMAVSEMFILLASCLCKGFQCIPAPE